ncbi:tripartite tricarboxylate transporter substrate binding protein [Roseomonas terrae]|uniref:Tripartite tricarboxylate transporter substrate binding protein n=1 Tax=Neoroseomonas terrae TaxID=424799 RepID=A0ABS5EKB7_9PROT|nr:tripartite tricarboxylate transporter substrate-binding protein [Neoroseomonas terrae]MBR0651467.1 tripartite tricarboxylate transporter substrate binding protein [Neoroseomonas terrae]
MIATRRAVLAAPVLLAATGSRAQPAWPDRPIRMLIGFPPGGPTDFIGRVAATGLQAAWGQTVVVENRAGAASAVAAEVVSRAAPDGHTLFFASNSVVLNGAIHPSLPYALPESFAPVGSFCSAPNVFWCAANQPWRDLAAVTAAARAQPGALAYGTTGVGGTGHFGGETLCGALGISLTHVPYRGTAPLMQDVIGGRVPLLAHGMAGAVGPYQAGHIRPLAVLGPRRAPELPEVPTMAELGHPVPDSGVWFGIMAPAGTAPGLVDRMARDLDALAKTDDTRTKLATQAAVPDFSGPHDFTARIRTELATWREVAQRVGIKPE